MAENKNESDLLARAQHLCSTREYCTGDIAAKLEQWGEKDEKVIGKIINRLTEENFINDERYSRAYASDHFRYQKWGKIKIKSGLKIKKIPSIVISSALAAIDEEEYIEALRSIIEIHRRTIRAKNRFDLRNKLLRYALAKGFESHLVYEVINSVVEG